MAIELSINGLFDMNIFDYYTGRELEKDIEQGVLDNLQQGEYFISISNRTIYDINDLQTPLYKFEFEPTDAVEYDFNEQ